MPSKKDKKRGRPSQSDTPESTTAKKAKQSRLSQSKVKADSPATTPLEKIKGQDWTPPKGTWDGKVQHVETIRQDEDGSLQVFLMWNDGKQSKHPVEKCYEKCPQTVGQFSQNSSALDENVLTSCDHIDAEVLRGTLVSTIMFHFVLSPDARLTDSKLAECSRPTKKKLPTVSSQVLFSVNFISFAACAQWQHDTTQQLVLDSYQWPSHSFTLPYTSEQIIHLAPHLFQASPQSASQTSTPEPGKTTWPTEASFFCIT